MAGFGPMAERTETRGRGKSDKLGEQQRRDQRPLIETEDAIAEKHGGLQTLLSSSIPRRFRLHHAQDTLSYNLASAMQIDAAA